MPLLTIVGAGPGMGLSIARQFGSRGFDVALVSRTQSKLDGLAADAGTLIFTTGAGSIDPIPMLGNVNAAAAALRNWVLNLHKALAGMGVHAAHVAINAWIGSGPPEAEADTIAARYWELYESPDVAEIHYTI